MTWAVPDWFELALLSLGAFRVWKLVADDSILDRPRGWALARLGDKTELLIVCPWCLGFWLSLAVWLLWVWEPHWTLVGCVPLAISAIVGLVGARLLD